MTPIARALNRLEDGLERIKRVTPKWLRNPRQIRIVIIAGTAVLGVIGALCGVVWIYYEIVEKPRQEREAAEARKRYEQVDKQIAELHAKIPRMAAEWKACQKHHPGMKVGMACPEPLETYENEAPTP